jgi:hypothetical protein
VEEVEDADLAGVELVVIGRTAVPAAVGTVLVAAVGQELVGTVALSRNVPGSPATWKLSFREGAKKGLNHSTVPMICRLVSSEVEAVARGDRSMQQCPLALDSLIVVRTLEVSSSAEVLLSFLPGGVPGPVEK